MEKAETQNVTGRGIRDGDKWLVVFKRNLTSQERFDAIFKEGEVTPVAFAVWDGSEGYIGGRKVVSTWNYVRL